MWVVEARKYRPFADYWYQSGLAQEESRVWHQKLYDQGWADVRSYKYGQ